jgi:ABC-type dipeptide/oligopeptide/nickel transport system permease subunit
MMKLWNDEAGFIVSAELVLIATILVLGMIVGLVSVRDQVVQELADIALAFGRINTSYSFSGITGHTSSTAGSILNDESDVCDEVGDNPSVGAACVVVTLTATAE